VWQKQLRVGPLDAEIEHHPRVDPFEDEAVPAVEGAAGEVFADQAAAAIVAGDAASEAPHQVGERVSQLAVGQAGELDPGGPIAIAGHRRIEGLVDETGDRAGGLARDGLGIVLRHRVVNVVRQLVDGAVADEGRRHVGGARSVLAVAPQAMLAVDGQTRWLGRRLRSAGGGDGEEQGDDDPAAG
jgi:hypothetical protein